MVYLPWSTLEDVPSAIPRSVKNRRKKRKIAKRKQVNRRGVHNPKSSRDQKDGGHSFCRLSTPLAGRKNWKNQAEKAVGKIPFKILDFPRSQTLMRNTHRVFMTGWQEIVHVMITHLGRSYHKGLRLHSSREIKRATAPLLNLHDRERGWGEDSIFDSPTIQVQSPPLSPRSYANTYLCMNRASNHPPRRFYHQVYAPEYYLWPKLSPKTRKRSPDTLLCGSLLNSQNYVNQRRKYEAPACPCSQQANEVVKAKEVISQMAMK